MARVLDTERKYFEANLSNFVREHENEFVLIRDRKAISFFPSEEEAVLAGRRKFGHTTPFLVALVAELPRTLQLSSYLMRRRS